MWLIHQDTAGKARAHELKEVIPGAKPTILFTYRALQEKEGLKNPDWKLQSLPPHGRS